MMSVGREAAQGPMHCCRHGLRLLNYTGSRVEWGRGAKDTGRLVAGSS